MPMAILTETDAERRNRETMRMNLAQLLPAIEESLALAEKLNLGPTKMLLKVFVDSLKAHKPLLDEKAPSEVLST